MHVYRINACINIGFYIVSPGCPGLFSSWSPAPGMERSFLSSLSLEVSPLKSCGCRETFYKLNM